MELTFKKGSNLDKNKSTYTYTNINVHTYLHTLKLANNNQVVDSFIRI